MGLVALESGNFVQHPYIANSKSIFVPKTKPNPTSRPNSGVGGLLVLTRCRWEFSRPNPESCATSSSNLYTRVDSCVSAMACRYVIGGGRGSAPPPCTPLPACARTRPLGGFAPQPPSGGLRPPE